MWCLSCLSWFTLNWQQWAQHWDLCCPLVAPQWQFCYLLNHQLPLQKLLLLLLLECCRHLAVQICCATAATGAVTWGHVVDPWWRRHAIAAVSRCRPHGVGRDGSTVRRRRRSSRWSIRVLVLEEEEKNHTDENNQQGKLGTYTKTYCSAHTRADAT